MSITEKAIVSLLENEPYYGHLILASRQILSNKVPTAGVNITDKVNLYINPDWFGTLNLEEQVAILKHECGHLIGAHHLRYEELKESKYKNRQNFNIATDLAINEYIPTLPKEIKLPNGDVGKPCLVENARQQYPDMQHRMHAEYYYDFLVDKTEQEGGEGSMDIGDLVDDHDVWNEGNGSSTMSKEILKNTLKDAADSTKRQAGVVPSEVLVQIDKLSKSVVNWKQQLRQFVAQTLETKLESTRKKRNRRYGIMYPGHKIEESLNLALAVDTSGSVSDEALQQFLAEINNIHKQGVNITIIECDSVVHNVYEYDPKKFKSFTGRGGTAYQPAFDKAKELKVDGVIFFGDGDCFDEPTKPKYPVLWALVGQSPAPAKFGRVIRIGDY